VRNYSPAWLDDLTLTGEVIWAGAGSLAGNDGWVSLHLADSAPLTLPERLEPLPEGELATKILESLAGGGAYFFRQLSNAVGSMDDKELQTTLWDLVWEGLVTNDTFAPLRVHLGGTVKKRTPSPSRARSFSTRTRASMPSAGGPPSVGGRWSLLPAPALETTIRAKANAELLLERHGVVTRGAVVNEGVRGGFALVYKVLSGFEETGRARRGYFIEGLGGAQFATGPTVDRLRSFVRDEDSRDEPVAVTLAATDPANPYGAALAWPPTEGSTEDGPRGHRPGRKAGAVVVLVDGELGLYLERGGKTALTFGLGEAQLAAASASLVRAVRERIGKARIDKVNGDFVIGTPLGDALVEAGFLLSPQGLRLRA